MLPTYNFWVHVTKGVIQRYRIFFSWKSLFFDIFGEKSSEWVKSCIFFFRGCIFFFRPLKTSEWVGSKLFLGKKKYTFLLGKKNTPQKCKNTFLQRGAAAQPSEWLSNYSWEKNKYICIFFFPEIRKKKNTQFSQNEWVSGVKLFLGKKNTVPLVWT